MRRRAACALISCRLLILARLSYLYHIEPVLFLVPAPSQRSLRASLFSNRSACVWSSGSVREKL